MLSTSTVMTPRRKRWIAIAAVAGLLVASLASLALRIPFSSEKLRSRVVATLADRLDSEVELGELTLHLFPRLHVVGTGLAIHHKGRRDVPPLISAEKFTVDADLVGLWRRHVAHVRLDGLKIQVPPGNRRDDDTEREAEKDAKSLPLGSSNRGHVAAGRQVVIDVVEAPEAAVIIIPRNPEKTPKTWYLHTLYVHSVSANTTMPFEALLTNGVPPGQIATEGSFGPWHRDDPGHTPVNGAFTFKNADLSVFKGISGILSAKGTYEGRLATIDVHGETDTPDFMVNISGHKVPLHTKYHAIVDGTNGDTTLERIDASFLRTALVAKGGVYDVKGVKGRRVTLDITMDQARIEDVMMLAVKTPKPPMTGALRLGTKFDLPPGDQDVVDKLRLSGHFAIGGGRFTDADVQSKINEMSVRALGKTGDGEPTPKVASDFSGQFALGGGVLALNRLTFNIPGAIVELKGQYALQRETLAFLGNLFMDAKVSEATTGWKSVLLKVVDPLFRKNGRTVIPLKISGTRNKPAFGMDVRRVFKPAN
jgi:hypothetical protein